MTYYQTPTKPTPKSLRPQTQNKPPHSQPHKPTDWICMVCQNLNFSFRKKCNRCKLQTRAQNQNQLAQASAYGEYYYEYDPSGGYGTDQGFYIQKAGKFGLADITNCQTPEGKYLGVRQNGAQVSGFCLSQNCRKSGYGASPVSISVPIPVEFTSSILDTESWHSITQQPEQQTHNPSFNPNPTPSTRKHSYTKNQQTFEPQTIPEQDFIEEKQTSICQFSDIEIEFLINRVLGNE